MPLTHCINVSLETSDIPIDFKTAKVVPLYKKGNKNEEGNYRPVSILPVVSKIFERVVYNQVCTYLNENNLIFPYQSGFRTGYCTDTALIYLGDKIRCNMGSGLYTGMVLIDLQKAFDTVNHNILCKKLNALGMGIYADDAAFVISGKNVSNIELSLSKNLESLSKWLEENKLSLHLGKTESILFGTHKKLAIRNDMNIQCKGIDIDSKPCVKYLGVNIDQDMSGTTIGSNYIKKINGKLKFLHRKVSFFRFEDRKMLSSALLQSHFDYACNFWFRNLNSNILHKFQTAQNKIIRYILQYSDRHHLEYSDFVKVQLLNVKHRVDYITLCHMYNVYNGSAPSYLCSVINSNVQTTTRIKQALYYLM